METLKKKYGFLTAIAMVVGIVIGSGVFFKADNVLMKTNGNLGSSLLAWTIGGLIMVISAYTFSLMAKRVEKINGVVDYIETAGGKKAGYVVGWYLASTYYPILVSILAFVSSDYFCTLLGIGYGIHTWIIAFSFMILSFLLNISSPKVAGIFQVSTTFIKLIPILIIAFVGAIMSFTSTPESVALLPEKLSLVTNDFGGAVLLTIFAYEGWVVATSINAEMRNSKTNLSRALIVGTLIVIGSYLLYYYGLSGILSNNEIINLGDGAPIVAANTLLGRFGGALFNAFVVFSCLGTLNGLTMGCIRGFYSLASRGQGPKPDIVANLNQKTNTSLVSSIIGCTFSIFFFLCWYLAIEKGLLPGSFDTLTIAFLYASYFIIYIWIMKNLTELNWVNRYLFPVLASICAAFLVFAASGLYHWIFLGSFEQVKEFLLFLGISMTFLVVGRVFYRSNQDE